MAAPEDILALNRAISQAERARAAPAPRSVAVDGRNLADLLAFAAEYGRLITFYDIANQPDGDWAVFFESDSAIALALRISLDLDGVQRGIDGVLRALRTAGAEAERLKQIEQAIVILQRLGWILTGGKAGGRDIDATLTALIRSERRDLLAAPASNLQRHLGGASPVSNLRRNHDGWLSELAELMDELAGALITALDQSRPITIAELQASFDDESHAPQSGLYDAFAALFRHAQATINRFPSRFIAFYRNDVLRQTTRAGRADSVYLTFTPDQGVARVDLPRGTRFVAGTDSGGQAIAYALDSALSVSAGSIAAIGTLRATTNSPHATLISLPAQVLSGTVILADQAPRIADPFPLFGAGEEGSQGSLVSVKATMGFVIASSTLMLAGGERKITLTFTLTDASHAEAWALCVAISEAAGQDQTQPDVLGPADVFVTLVEHGFALRCSTASGWIPVADYQVAPITEAERSFTLAFTLDADAAPFVAESTGSGNDLASADAGTPLLVARLLQDSFPFGIGIPEGGELAIYPYALLSKLVLAALEVDVDVTGFTQVEVTTPTGPADISQPFPVFGNPPVQGSTLQVRADELFAKALTRFNLTLDWYGLPVTSTGFEGYYRAYIVNADGETEPPGSQFNNESFVGTLAVVNPGWWKISEDQLPYQLFTVAEAQPQVEACYDAMLAASEPPDHYDSAASAISLTLTEPDTAFGNILYAPNVMAASVQLTAAASACAQQCGQTPAGKTDTRRLAAVAAANRRDWRWANHVKAAVEAAAAEIDGSALQAIEQAIAAIEAEPATLQQWHDSLSEARAGEPRGLHERVQSWWNGGDDAAAAAAARVGAWLDDHGAAMPTTRLKLLANARAYLDAAADLRTLPDSAAGLAPGIARSIVDTGLARVDARLAEAGDGDDGDCINDCLKNAGLIGFPNQPWLPQASRIAVDYTASTSLPATGAAPAPRYLHLLPFDEVAATDWSHGPVAMIAPIAQPGALFLAFSEAVEDLAMFFLLAPPPGGWPAETAPVGWAEGAGANGWKPLAVIGDTTNDMQNSGIVSMTIAPGALSQAPVLRLSTQGDPGSYPYLAGVATNAGTARWVGPGGSATLGVPLAAGAITKSEHPIAGLGSVDQPLPSAGGAPRFSGSLLEPWLAERLHHKDRGIQGWDYATLALAAFPSLWQVAVVPATNGAGRPDPGHVWIVPIPGPETPAIADRTEPTSDSQMIADLKAYLAPRISPFITLAVTNPPYLRIRVDAELIFTGDDAAEASAARLNEELIAYLSPWPSAAIGPRPGDYYTRKEIAHFIRHRPYIRAIISLKLVYAGETARGWRYLTSAERHDIDGKVQSGDDAPLLPRAADVLPARIPLPPILTP